jgi:L,D-transpeptidase catalytic domain
MGRALKALMVVFVGVAGLGPATAAAVADTTSSTTTTTTTPAPAPSGSLALYLRGAFSLGHQQVTIPGRVVQVEGVERPYVPGQRVTMGVYLNGRLRHTYQVRIRKGKDGKSGRFTFAVRSPASGHISIVAKHLATSTLRGFGARHGYEVLDPRAGFGARNDFVKLIQRRLSVLHIYVPQSGAYDSGTGLAIDAYHRLMRWGTSQSLDQRTVNALLDGQGRFNVRYPGDGRHAEGNLGLQLLALINGSHVYWILPISSGKPSTPTILGRFHVYRKSPGLAPDGMYYSSYFYTGYAIHGFNPAPDFPASHGCMRLPIADAIPVYNWLQMGDAVDTYY